MQFNNTFVFNFRNYCLRIMQRLRKFVTELVAKKYFQKKLTQKNFKKNKNEFEQIQLD
jgi:hypothetical protein